MLNFTTQAVREYNGLSDGRAKRDISVQLRISPQSADEVVNWVYSLKVDNSMEYQHNYYPRPSTSRAQDETTDDPEINDNPALSPSQGAYDAGIEPYEHRL